ncbi:MAG: hypothetical protein AAGH15_15775 [Myxococcota bacterium]
MRFAMGLGLALLGASSCSLTTADVGACASSQECRVAFGVGAVCEADGYCRTEALPPRCELRLPEGASADPTLLADTVPIATVVDLSLDSHAARANSVELALVDASRLGVEGRGFSLVVCTNQDDFQGDGLDRSAASLSLGTYLEDIGTRVVVGPPASSDAEAVFGVTEDVLFINPSATSNALTGLDPSPATDTMPGRFWRTAAPDEQQGIRIAEDVRSRDVATLAIVHANDPYGTGLRDVVVAVLAAGEEDVEVIDFPFENGDDTSFGVAVASAASTPTDEVLFVSSQTEEAVAFATSAATLPGFAGRSLFLTDSAGNEDFAAEVRTDTQARQTCGRIRGTRPAVAVGFVTDLFRSLYQSAEGEDPTLFGFASNSYDAGWLAAISVAWGVLQEDGDLSWPALARGLRNVSAGTEVNLDAGGFATVLSAFARGESVNVTGASGTLDYDVSTEETMAPTELWVIDDDCDLVVLPDPDGDP